MKKKLLLIIAMFLFITNVSALTFDVDVTNIEDEGNNGTLGSITSIDLENKTINAYFQDIGDEVSFSITVTNTGDRAGTLRSIEFEGTNKKIVYTSSLPDGGIAINGNDTNEVIVTARVKEGAINKTSSSTITINYSYDEGSCPDGEILSDDESMCLCPEGMERNEQGVCIKPEKEEINCKAGEIYNTKTKQCEKKVAPAPVPDNPKTLDNIILITLLFIVSGLGIYAVMFKKLNTTKKKISVGVITGVATLSLSFTVLASVFGLDNLLSAIVNPITKSKSLTLTVNEKIDLLETWDGGCSLDGTALTPENIFNGGTGTEEDPYQVDNGEQLSCLAKSVNLGTTYEGQYIKQTRNIKLNDHLINQVDSGNLDGVNVWSPIGIYHYDNQNSQNSVTKPFYGTYDGDNKIISGLYIDDNSYGDYKALFGCTVHATIKNLTLSDTYLNSTAYEGTLVGYGLNSLTIDNIKTYGKAGNNPRNIGGMIAEFTDNGPSTSGMLKIENVENNIDLLNGGSTKAGIIASISMMQTTEEPNLIIRNAVNNGDVNISSTTGGIVGVVSAPFPNVLIENAVNNGNFSNSTTDNFTAGGIVGFLQPYTGIIRNSYNTGNMEYHPSSSSTYGGIVGSGTNSNTIYTIDNCFNSGDITFSHISSGTTIGNGINTEGMTEAEYSPYWNYAGTFGGLVGTNGSKLTITNSHNSGNFTTIGTVGGLIGSEWGETSYIENCYNEGNITASSSAGGLIGTGGYKITKSYNTGNITVFANDAVAGLVGTRSRNAAEISYCYNEGDVTMKSKINSAAAGGLCTYCKNIRNSYNRGNITSEYAGGSYGSMSPSYTDTGVENVYNSGTIAVRTKNRETDDSSYGSIYVSGFLASNGYVKNAYNLGDLIIERNESYYTYSDIGGAMAVSGNTKNNIVNTGNITLKINVPFTTRQSIALSGIGNFYNGITNSFNAGTITLDDSALDHRITEEVVGGQKHNIFVGEITASYGDANTGNKFNTSSSNKALGCFKALEMGTLSPSEIEACTDANSNLVGVYTNEATPDILSIINADSDDEDSSPDNAFEILEGETLPTLKVFNQ